MALAHNSRVVTGIAKVEIADVAPITALTAWSELFYTLKDSLKISQPVPARTDIEVDQVSDPIGTIYKAGVLTAEFDIPDVAKEILDVFFSTSTPTYVPTGYDAVGMSLDVNIIKKMIKITFDTDDYLVITNGTLVSNINIDTPSTKAAAVHVTCTALSPDINGEPEAFNFYVKTA